MRCSRNTISADTETGWDEAVYLTVIASLCPRYPEKAFFHSPVSRSQTHSLLSLPELANTFSSPLIASDNISSVWPLISGSGGALPFPSLSVEGLTLYVVASFLPVFRSHLKMWPSFPEVNRYFPFSEATAEVTEKRCPPVFSTARVGVLKSNCK